MRIAVFGGTFDPPHLGHLNIAKAVLEKKYADLILFTPAYVPPHKQELKISPFNHRFEMLKILIRNEKNMQISDIEEKLKQNPSYTFNTLLALTGIYKNDELILLIGTDSLSQIHTWYKFEEIIKKWRIISYPRTGFLISNLNFSKKIKPEFVEILRNRILKDLPTFDISSSEIRKCIKEGKKDIAKYLSTDVYSYILVNKLYTEN